MNNTPYQDYVKTITSPEFTKLSPQERLPILGRAFKAGAEQSQPYRDAIQVAAGDPVAVQKINLAAADAFKQKYKSAFEVVVNPGTENPAWKQWEADKVANPMLPDEDAPKQFLGREVRMIKSPAQEHELSLLQGLIKSGGTTSNGFRPLSSMSVDQLKYVDEVYGSEDSYLKRQVQLEYLARQQGVQNMGEVDTTFPDEHPALAAGAEYLKGVVRGGVVTPYITIRRNMAALVGGVVGLVDKRAGRIATEAYKDEDTLENRTNPFSTAFDAGLSATTSGTSPVNAAVGNIVGTLAGFAVGGKTLSVAGEAFGAKTLTNTLVQSAALGTLYDTGDLIFNTTGEEEGFVNQATHNVGTIATNMAFDLALKGLFTTAKATVAAAKTVVQTGEKAPLLQTLMKQVGERSKSFGATFADDIVKGWVDHPSYIKAHEKLAQLTEQGVVDGKLIYTRAAPSNPIETVKEALRPTFTPLSKWTQPLMKVVADRVTSAPTTGLDENQIVNNIAYLRSWRMNRMTSPKFLALPVLGQAKTVEEVTALLTKEGKNMTPFERNMAERIIATSRLEQDTKAALLERQKAGPTKKYDGTPTTDYEQNLEKILAEKSADFPALQAEQAAAKKAAQEAAAAPQVDPNVEKMFNDAQDVLHTPKRTDAEVMTAVSNELVAATNAYKAAKGQKARAVAKEALIAAFEKHQKTEVEQLIAKVSGIKNYEESAAMISELQKRFDETYLKKHGNNLPDFLRPIAKEQRKAVVDLFDSITRKGEAKLTTDYRVGTQYAIKTQTEALTDAIDEKQRILLALRDQAVGTPERAALVKQLAENEEYLRAATEGRQTLVDMTGDLATASPESIAKTLDLLDGVLPAEQVTELRRLSQSLADKKYAAENSDILLMAREKQAREFNLNKESERLQKYWTEQNAQAEARTTADMELEAQKAEALRFEKDLAAKDATIEEIKKAIEAELEPYFAAEKDIASANKEAAKKVAPTRTEKDAALRKQLAAEDAAGKKQYQLSQAVKNLGKTPGVSGQPVDIRKGTPKNDVVGSPVKASEPAPKPEVPAVKEEKAAPKAAPTKKGNTLKITYRDGTSAEVKGTYKTITSNEASEELFLHRSRSGKGYTATDPQTGRLWATEKTQQATLDKATAVLEQVRKAVVARGIAYQDYMKVLRDRVKNGGSMTLDSIIEEIKGSTGKSTKGKKK